MTISLHYLRTKVARMAIWDRERLFRLIPEAQSFDWIAGVDPRDLLFHVGSIGHAIAYADLFWPTFVEHEGCVLLADRLNPPNFQEWMNSTNGDRRAAETVLNHTHITDLFNVKEGEVSLEQVIHLGQLLRAMWTAKLAADFPDRRFVVSFPEGHLDSLQDYEISFHQV